MSSYSFDAAEVKAAASQNIKQIICDLYPDALIRGAEARLGNLDGEKGKANGGSLAISINPEKFGSYFDHATDEKGNLIDILSHLKGYTYGQAIEWLGQQYTTCTTRKYEARPLKQRAPLLAQEQYQPLSQQVGEYAIKTRQLSAGTLKAYDVRSATNDPTVACFLSYDSHDQVAKVEYVSTTEKKFRSSMHCDHHLFGKPVCHPEKTQGTVVITEGRWDAMSYYEAGYPAVSIPSGIKNTAWIDEDWEWLQQFHTILLSMDMDDKGQEALPDIVRRLGVHKCQVIKLKEKDASDMLQKGLLEELKKAYGEAEYTASSLLVSASDLREETFTTMQGGVGGSGDPWFFPGLDDFKIRPNEMTLVFGPTGHGKSQTVSNQVAFDANRQIQTVIYSAEQTNHVTMASLIRQFSGNRLIHEDRAEYDRLYDAIEPFVTIYKSTQRADPRKLLEQFIYAYERKGVTRFILDNVMSLGANRDDNAEQARIAHMFREFTKEYPIHLTVLAHPRKPSDNNKNTPPTESDISGASEWGSIPENILVVWRNKQKGTDIEIMRQDNRSEVEIAHYVEQVPDGELIVEKQRDSGELPRRKTWFDKSCQIVMPGPGLPTPFYKPAPVERDTTEDPF